MANNMDLSGGYSGRAMTPEQQVEYYRRLAEIEGMDAARRIAYAPGDPTEADWQGIDPAYRTRATSEDLDTSRRRQGDNQTGNMLTLAMLLGPLAQAYAPGLLAESAVASPVASGTAAGVDLGLLGTAGGGLTEAQIAAMSMGSDMAAGAGGYAGAGGAAAGLGATGAANPLQALYGGTMPTVAEMGMGDALATGAGGGAGAISGGSSLLDYLGSGKTIAQLAGAALGAAAGGDKTTSKDPWEPAQQWIKDNIASGQTMQQHYQQQPFSDPMKQASQNMFTGIDNFNRQTPGLLDFANQMMTHRYSYGGTPPTTAAAFTAPQMGQFGQIDFNKMNPFYKG